MTASCCGPADTQQEVIWFTSTQGTKLASVANLNDPIVRSRSSRMSAGSAGLRVIDGEFA